MLGKLRKEFIELLERDVEFRYTVMGYLGISEIIKKLDVIAEEQIKLREDFKELRGEQIKLRKDFSELRKEQIELRKDFRELRKEQIKLREDFKELREEQIRLREDFNKMLSIVAEMSERLGKVEVRLSRVERTLEKLTLDIEDEAREILSSRLKDLDIDVTLNRLELPDLELNIYGASNDVCVIGEATVRLGVDSVRKFIRKFRRMSREFPNYLRPKVILVIYTSLATKEAIREAEEKGVWILKPTKDLTRPPKV